MKRLFFCLAFAAATLIAVGCTDNDSDDNNQTGQTPADPDDGDNSGDNGDNGDDDDNPNGGNDDPNGGNDNPNGGNDDPNGGEGEGGDEPIEPTPDIDYSQYFTDPLFLEYVLANFDADKDGNITGNELLAVTEIDVAKAFNTPDEQKIASLSGIQLFPNLETLYCYNNRLTELDLTRNTKLKAVHLVSNPLQVLNMGDVNPAKWYYYNGQVYDDFYENYPKFNTYALGDSARLKVVGSKISKLDVTGNSLQSLDVSDCPSLTALYCLRNQLTVLDLSKNGKLTELHCGANSLTALNVSACTALADLQCDTNRLTELNVSACAALTTLLCQGNQLTALDLSQNKSLYFLMCQSTLLKELDVSKTNMGIADAILYCPDTLEKLYLKKGWSIKPIGAPSGVEIIYVD